MSVYITEVEAKEAIKGTKLGETLPDYENSSWWQTYFHNGQIKAVVTTKNWGVLCGHILRDDELERYVIDYDKALSMLKALRNEK